jgi:hypothetical protein
MVSMAAVTSDAPPSAAPVREWHFQVLLDGRPIGRHDFTVTGTEAASEVVSHARFVVTLLRIPVYRYEHEDHERWQNGCLVQMDSRTNDNGQQSQVQGAAAADGFRVLGSGGTHTWPGCVHSFGYWDPRILAARQLLNAQTGGYEAVELARDADVSGVPGATEHYRLEGRGLHIELWYDAHGTWLALESRTKEGKRLRYQSPLPEESR